MSHFRTNETSPIIAHLESLNYKFKRDCVGNVGYSNVYSDGHEAAWITFDLIANKVHIYGEYDCGGELYQYEFDLPDEIIYTEDVDGFIKWCDDNIEQYLENKI